MFYITALIRFVRRFVRFCQDHSTSHRRAWMQEFRERERQYSTPEFLEKELAMWANEDEYLDDYEVPDAATEEAISAALEREMLQVVLRVRAEQLAECSAK